MTYTTRYTRLARGVEAVRYDAENDHMDPLAEAVYDFLVSEGYHAHYPSAEEQAEKFVASLRAEGWRVLPPAAHADQPTP